MARIGAGVEIEIEEGLFPPNTIEEVRTVVGGQYMSQDSGHVYVAVAQAPLPHGGVYNVDKSNFLAVPPFLALTDPTDTPVGIANDATFIYVLSRTTTGSSSVTRILKANFLTQARVVAPDPSIHTPNQRPIVDGTDLVFCATDSGGIVQGIVKLDLVGFAAFTFVADTDANVTLNSAVVDLVNNKYWICSNTIALPGPCSPAILSVDRVAFTFDARICGAFTQITRWPCIPAGEGINAFICDGVSLFGSDPTVVPNRISRLDVPGLVACIVTTLPGVSQVGGQGNIADFSSNILVIDNQAPANVFKMSKATLGLVSTHTLPALSNNGNFLLVDTSNQFIYALTISGTARLTRFGFGLI